MNDATQSVFFYGVFLLCVFLQGAREESLHLLRRFYKVSLHMVTC